MCFVTGLLPTLKSGSVWIDGIYSCRVTQENLKKYGTDQNVRKQIGGNPQPEGFMLKIGVCFAYSLNQPETTTDLENV